MRFRNDKLESPRIKRWTQDEYDDSVRRGFLDGSAVLLREGNLFSRSSGGEEIPKRWTKSEYYEKVELGFLCKQRVFLYRGELIEMPVMGHLHARCCQMINYWLFDQRGDNGTFEYRIRSPFDVPGESMPEPDAVVMTRSQEKRFPHPNAAVLIIEVSEASPQMERERAFDYAAAGVPEYWIANPHARTVEIFREPVADGSSGTGYKYASHQLAGEAAVLSPVFKPGARLKVADVFEEIE